MIGYEKVIAHREQIGIPVVTYTVTIKALNKNAEEMIGKETELVFDYYYDTSDSEEEVKKELIKNASNFKDRPERFWRIEGGRIKFYSPTELKKDKDYKVKIKKTKHEIPEPMTFDDIKAL